MNIVSFLRVALPIMTNIVVISIIYVGIRYIRHDKRRSVFATPLVFWAGHAFVFYCVTIFRYIFIDISPTDIMSMWSGVVRLHGALAVLVFVYNLHLMNGNERDIYTYLGKDSAYNEVVGILEKRLSMDKALEE